MSKVVWKEMLPRKAAAISIVKCWNKPKTSIKRYNIEHRPILILHLWWKFCVTAACRVRETTNITSCRFTDFFVKCFNETRSCMDIWERERERKVTNLTCDAKSSVNHWTRRIVKTIYRERYILAWKIRYLSPSCIIQLRKMIIYTWNWRMTD